MNKARQVDAISVALLLAVILGLYVRLFPVLLGDFPLNDGGLFYLMAQEVRAAHYALPAYTAYNAAHIPFAYPPLSFYLAALLADLTGASVITVLRFFPALFSTLAIVAFYGFSREVLQSRLQAIFATFAFAFFPRAYGWMIMGGGLTRAPGFCFAILSLWQAYRLYQSRDPRAILTTTLCTTLTALTHAEMTWFIVYSIFLLWLFFGHDLKTLAASLIVAVGTVIGTAPWWVTVVSRHGLAPYQAAAHTGGGRWFSWHPSYITGESWPILGYLALGGFLLCLTQKRFYVPIWTVLIFIIQARSARTLAVIPMAMAIGLVLDQAILPFLGRFNSLLFSRTPAPETPASTVQNTASPVADELLTEETKPSRLGGLQVVLLEMLLLYALLTAWFVDVAAPQLRSLSTDDRAAMQWAQSHTPASSRFVLLTSDAFWDDRTSEWFPALTGRVSVATVQGSEWLPHNRFFELWQRADDLAACAKSDTKHPTATPDGANPNNPAQSHTAQSHTARSRTARSRTVSGVPCLEKWGASNDAAFDYIYIRKEPSESLKKGLWKTVAKTLRVASSYRKVYDGPGALIFARIAP